LGASPEQITSWFWALGLGIGLSGLILSWKFKYPVATAWSTAGLALIMATGSGYSLNEAIGAFLVGGLLTAILGFSGIFQKALSYIPQSLTSAMLAGVLLKFGISLFASLQNDWAFVLSLLSIYVITKRLWPRYSIVFTVIAGIALCPVFLEFHMPTIQWSLAKPVWISPDFSWSALLGLALPLFVISMASQYLPGIAMIKSYGYKPHVNQLIGWTGLTQVVLAPFGCYSVNI
ncbi:benzoate/H(+) symporter BenE family transporter, partial [Acinetobacter sp. A11]